MSASRLLRILQTLPPAADDGEISAFNGESKNRSSRCTNPFLSNEANENEVDFWNNPQLETSIFGNNYTNDDEDETFRKSSSACNNVRSDLFEETTRFYIDKNAVECELPELIVCYKESDIHIKDICINQEMADDETIPADKDDHEFPCKSVPVVNEDDDDDDMIEASLDTEFPKDNWVTGCFMDADLKSLQKVTYNSCPDISRKSCNENLNSSTYSQNEVSANYADDNDQQPLNKVSKAEKLGTSSRITKILNERDIEGSVDLHFDTKKPETGSDPAEIDLNYLQDMAVEKHETRYVEGESSFSMAGVITELISCSRPIAFSGGMSTRSDGSTTSTRSFAFPTLETEYVNSPVRMGRSERRRLQKQRGWRQGLLCCKF